MAKAIFFDMTQTLQIFDFERMQKEFKKILLKIPMAKNVPIKKFMKAYFSAYDLYQAGRISNDKEFCNKIFSKLHVKLTIGQENFFIRQHLFCRKKFISLAPLLKKTLLSLKKNGFRLGLLSNGVSNWVGFDWKFLKFNPNNFFEKQAYSQETGLLKPDKRAYEFLLEKMKLPASDVVFVGDNFEHDILGPKALGMKTVWVNNGKKKGKADFVIKQLSQLQKIKQQLLLA